MLEEGFALKGDFRSDRNHKQIERYQWEKSTDYKQRLQKLKKKENLNTLTN